jgi:gamma-F420-2:alpha-L-glutamate ligase
MFSAMRSVEPLAQYLKSREIKVFDNNLFSHKYSMNKVFDITKLIFSDVPVPDYFHARNYEDLFDYAETMKYPAIIKTAGTGKGSAIYMVNNTEEMKKALILRQNENIKSRKIVIQNFIDYKYDLRILVIGDKMYCMRRIPKSGDFRANFSLGGSVELFPLTEELRKLASKAISAIGLEVAGVDVLIDKNNKKYILEVNHTPGMVGMEAATGENITKIYLDYAISHAKKI